MGEVEFSIGLKSREHTGISPITLCIGNIPIQRISALPWINDKVFPIEGISIIMNSFQFKTNIGRNVVYLDTPFVSELLPKFFRKIILEFYVEIVAEAYSSAAYSSVGSHGRDYNNSIIQLFSSLCCLGNEHGFEIPQEVMRSPFICNYVGYKPYSINELDQHQGVIYYTLEEPDEWIRLDNKILCISISNLSWNFRNFIKDRYKDRLHEIESRILIIDEDKDEINHLTRKVREKLDCTENKPPYYSSTFFDGNNVFSLLNIKIKIAKFLNLDKGKDFNESTLYHKSTKTLYLNYDNDYINDLIKLLFDGDGQYVEHAAHFLMREIIYTPDLPLGMYKKRQLLQKDLVRRFGKKDDVFDFFKRLSNKDFKFDQL